MPPVKIRAFNALAIGPASAENHRIILISRSILQKYAFLYSAC